MADRLTPQASDSSRHGPIRVLYVDDHQDARSALARTLRKNERFEVELADCGAKALELAKRLPFDVVLSDLHMPGMSGIETIARLGRLLPRASFALVTGATELVLPTEMEDSELIACILRKPWEADELVATLEHAVKLRRAPSARNSHSVTNDHLERVLLVEDNTADADYVSACLLQDRPKCQITHVETLSEAVTLLEQETFCAVVADLGLPDARGIDVVVRLQVCSGSAPIIVLSGRSDDGLAMHAVDVGAQDYLVKSDVTGATLDRALRYAIQRTGAVERLSYLAHYDSLTDLANRRLFMERASRALGRARRSQKNIGVLMLDLDHFKTINDSFGHDAGDVVLQAVALRIQGAARESDTVARLGGDEFVVLVEELEETHDLGALAARILESMRAPIRIDGNTIQVTSSIGISSSQSFSQSAPPDVDELLKTSDSAMYRAKSKGRNSYQFFDEGMHARDCYRHSLKSDLLGALERGEFEIFYQPIISIEPSQPLWVEALLRWNHPVQGVIMPSVFVPLLEELGQIIPVGEWALRRACAQSGVWLKRLGLAVRVTLNVSAKQFDDPDLATKIELATQAAQLPSYFIAIDVSETTLVRDAQHSQRVLSKLHATGVRLCMDDFGIAASTIATIAKFPLDVIKIHTQLVSEIGAGTGDSVIRALTQMIRSLGRQALAVGVESTEQLALLQSVGCELFQGNIRCAALSGPDATRWIKRSGGDLVSKIG